MYKEGNSQWWWSPDDSIQTAILADLDATKKQLRFKIYAITLKPLVDILIAKHQAGIDCAGILDLSQSYAPAAPTAPAPAELQPFATMDVAFPQGVSESTQIVRLREAGFPIVIGVSSHGQIIHEKAYVRDSRYVGMGSYNWSLSAQSQENHFCLTDSVKLAKVWLDNWNTDWKRLGGGVLPAK